jgi:homopolymeric O-antigen transport system permease protein
LQLAGKEPNQAISQDTGSVVSRGASAELRSPTHTLAKVSIDPPKRWVSIDFRELWEAREVLYYLTWRDIKVRYKQTALGAAWILLQPLATMVIYSILFGRVAKMPSEGVPYPIFILTALIPWNLFAAGLTRGADSLTSNSPLLKKVYLPRLVLPLSRILSGLIDFFLSFLLLVVMVAWYHIRPSAHALYLPFFLALAVAASTGATLWLSALNVRMRDIQQAVPFLVQLWFFASPVAYSSSLVKGRWHVIYGLNPMAGVVEGFRWALLGTRSLSASLVAISLAGSILLLVSGALFFRKMEQTFADIV